MNYRHEDLIMAGGTYATMWEQQLKNDDAQQMTNSKTEVPSGGEDSR